MTSCASAPIAASHSGQSESPAELRDRLESRLELCRRDLAEFHSYVNGWPVPEHQRRLCDLWEWVEQTPDARLIVTMPPRHGKTETEVSAIAWMLARAQAGLGTIERAALAMYGVELARGYAAQVRDLFDGHGLGLDVYPECRLASRSDTGWRFAGQPAGRPTMIAVGVSGPVTGRGVDLLAIDDPIKTAEEARSTTYRERAWRWWQQTARTRLQPGGRVVLTMTRWHEDDLAGRLLDQGGWRHIHLPAIDDDGMALWPEQYSVDALEAIRSDSGPAAFEALYQGRPTPSDGDVWRRDWFEQAYHTGPQPEFELCWTAWDTAFKTGAGNDYTAGIRFGRRADGHIHVLGIRRRRMKFTELISEIEIGLGGDVSEVAVVEDKASGQSAIQTMQEESKRPVVAVKADTDKEARARAVTPMAQAGWVHLDPSDAGTPLLLAELLAFPNGTHDDLHDAFVHGLAFGRLSGQVWEVF